MEDSLHPQVTYGINSIALLVPVFKMGMWRDKGVWGMYEKNELRRPEE
jgi:hypothetical protein